MESAAPAEAGASADRTPEETGPAVSEANYGERVINVADIDPQFGTPSFSGWSRTLLRINLCRSSWIMIQSNFGYGSKHGTALAEAGRTWSKGLMSGAFACANLAPGRKQWMNRGPGALLRWANYVFWQSRCGAHAEILRPKHQVGEGVLVEDCTERIQPLVHDAA